MALLYRPLFPFIGPGIWDGRYPVSNTTGCEEATGTGMEEDGLILTLFSFLKHSPLQARNTCQINKAESLITIIYV